MVARPAQPAGRAGVSAPALSILQLDTRFPRIPGDVASPESYTAPVDLLRVPRASVAEVVRADPMALEIAPFETALAKARGHVIATSCGFLAPWQEHLAALSDKKVVASALGALDHLVPRFGPGSILIVTFDAAALGPAHLGRYGRAGIDIVGLRRGDHLREVIASDSPRLDSERAASELLALVSDALVPRHRIILLECTNLPPHAALLRRETGRSVHDILTEIDRAAPGVVQRKFIG